MPTDTFDSTGTWTAPANVSSPVKVECWGSGGDGGAANTGGQGGGGGGAAYASSTTIAVTGNTVYTVTVGVTPTGAGDGLSSWFNTSGTILAVGGKHGIGSDLGGGAGGAGGLASACIGTVKRDGGTGSDGGTWGGGGGGGSAGSNNAGGSASNTTVGGSAGTVGGAAGGTGVDILTDNGTNTPGNVPGSGGGGANSLGSPASYANVGGHGRVTITYSDITLEPSSWSQTVGSAMVGAMYV